MMKNKIQNIMNICVFSALLGGIGLINILKPDKLISYTERRKLESFPKFTAGDLKSGTYFNNIEKYAMDQFLFRDKFRSIHSYSRLNIFMQAEINDLYIYNNGIYKILYPYNKSAVKAAVQKMNRIQNKFLKELNVNYSVIPDKSYFVSEKMGYPSIDYTDMLSCLSDELSNINYIDITGSLNESNYYLTDPHWKQESLLDTADIILNKMGADTIKPDFNYKKYEDFKGSYCGQLGLPGENDELIVLENNAIESAKVFDFEKNEYISVYNTDIIKGYDPYDIYLWGARALLRIENQDSLNKRRLYIFRDSFGSSIAPLFIDSYSEIILIDLRYIREEAIEQLVEFTPGSDALFLYSTLLLNQNGIW